MAADCQRRLWHIFLIGLIASCHTFKQEDFKKCKDSAFCQRLRGKSWEGYEVVGSSVDVNGPELSALVTSGQSDSKLQLTLTHYESALRVRITEVDYQRAEVPYVLLDSLEKKALSWQKPKLSKNSATLQIADTTAVLTYKPFTLEVKRGRSVLVSLNSRNMFAVEQTRTKQEGDPDGWWEESFKQWTDSKPKGPQALSLDLSFPASDHVYGIPEHAKAFSLPPTVGEGIESEPYRMYNLDVFEHDQDSNFGLYGSIPFLTSHTATSTTGVFWLNAAEMLVDVEKTRGGTDIQWLSEGGIVDLFIFPGPSPAEVLKQYSLVTGTTQMPQYFSIGYHQCRWNYKDEQDVHQVDTNFDKYDIPYDVIWLDIEHTDGKRYFTWDKGHFPTPEKMEAQLDAHGRKLVTIIDPHLKKDDSYYVYKQAKDKGFFTKDKNGNDFEGWCWPGASSYMDVFNPDAVAWWGSLFDLKTYKGSASNLYVWNDMNEPSVFNGPEITMPKDNIHHGGLEHRDVHNMHGMLFHRATSLGIEQRGAQASPDGDRSFVLTRSFYAGSQRWGPLWTGDNTATWESLRVSVPMILALSIAGYPWAGADVGGFFKNPSPELLTRWNQVGAFYPFFRGHAHLDSPRREPWVHGEPTTSHIKAAIRMRYELLPYIYTLFRETHEEGSAIWRPLWYEFPSQTNLFAIDDAFMLGSAVLVAPVLQEGISTRNVTLPSNAQWYEAASGEAVSVSGWGSSSIDVPVTIESVPMFFRGGSIIPIRERARRSTAAAALDPFTLIVVLDKSGTARGSLYIDDGHSHAHEKGRFTKLEFTFAKNKLSSKVVSSGFEHTLQVERIRIVGLGKPGSKWRGDLGNRQQSLEVEWGPVRLRDGLPSSTLVVRKPELSLSEDWSLDLVKA